MEKNSCIFIKCISNYRNLRGNLNEGFLLKVPQKLSFAK